MRFNSWKTAGLAMLLSLAASPALASGDGAATADLPAGTAGLDQAAVSLVQLAERVAELEKRVDRFGVAHPPPAAEPKRARLEEERQAELLKQIWSAP